MERFTIFKGELTDAPGRHERWIETVVSLGGDQWQLEVDDTGFQGRGENNSWSEQFSTDELVSWITEQDDLTDDESKRKVRLNALKRYAEKNGFGAIIHSIEKLTKPPQLPPLKVTSVSGVKLFPNGLHPRSKRDVPYLVIETTRGKGLMPIPQQDAKCLPYFLGTNYLSKEVAKNCQPTKELKQQIERSVTEHLESEQQIRVKFFTIVVKKSSKTRPLTKKHTVDAENSFLLSINTMSYADVDSVLDDFRQVGVVPGHDLAVGDMMSGELIPCPQIKFVRTSESFPPKWIATFDPFYKT